MTLQPVNDTNLGDRVADQLREAIHRGRLAPGDRLIERRLAEDLGVSHIPVREALSRLAEEGLVERLPRRGSRVAVLTHRDIEEISSLRIILEQFVAVRVQERVTDRIERELFKIVTAMLAAARKGDTRAVFNLDRRFHEELWRLSDHGMLNDLVAQLRIRITGFLRAATGALEVDALVEHAWTHDKLLRAILSGDPEAARSAMAEHITVATERLLATMPPDNDADIQRQ